MALSTVNPHPIEHSTPPNLQNGTRLRLVRRAVWLCLDVEISHAPYGAMRGGGLGGASTHQPQGVRWFRLHSSYTNRLLAA